MTYELKSITDDEVYAWADRMLEQRKRMEAVWKAPIIWVIDPAGCGCTDCIVGDSIPADLLTDEQKHDIEFALITTPQVVLDRR